MDLSRRVSNGLFEQTGTDPETGEPRWRRIALAPFADEVEHPSIESAIFEHKMLHDPKPPPSREQLDRIAEEFAELADTDQAVCYTDEFGRRVGAVYGVTRPVLTKPGSP